MKAEKLTERPNYDLFKQNDVVSFYHVQLPRWLFEDRRYMPVSIEAKVAYSMLLGRFQLSKLNGWINEDGEVFIIYTRKELSAQLNISEKRVSAAMNELKEFKLIWERRRGRGFANQIYLANVKISIDDALNSKGGPLDPPDTTVDIENKDEGEGTDLRPDETTVLNKEPQEKESSLFSSSNDDIRENGCFLMQNSDMEAFEPPEQNFKNRQNCGSKNSDSPVQEPPKRPPNYIDFRLKDSIYNQSQSMSSPYDFRMHSPRHDGQTDVENVEFIIRQAELEFLDENDAVVMRDAIERLYFMQHIRIGNAIYPNDRIRSNLWRLDGTVVEDALHRIAKNSAQIRNSSAYVVTVLFNTIMEAGSDLIVDPYLNSLRPQTREKSNFGGDINAFCTAD